MPLLVSLADDSIPNRSPTAGLCRLEESMSPPGIARSIRAARFRCARAGLLLTWALLLERRTFERSTPARAMKQPHRARPAWRRSHPRTKRSRPSAAHNLPDGMEPGSGLQATYVYDPPNFIWPSPPTSRKSTPRRFRSTLRRYVAADDVGRVINPTIVDGQIYGAIAQALLEEASRTRTATAHRLDGQLDGAVGGRAAVFRDRAH